MKNTRFEDIRILYTCQRFRLTTRYNDVTHSDAMFQLILNTNRIGTQIVDFMICFYVFSLFRFTNCHFVISKTRKVQEEHTLQTALRIRWSADSCRQSPPGALRCDVYLFWILQVRREWTCRAGVLVYPLPINHSKILRRYWPPADKLGLLRRWLFSQPGLENPR